MTRRTSKAALVLGSLTLAFIWSFGFWPSWHWRAFPAWLVLSAVVVWAVARQRPWICNASWVQEYLSELP